MTYNTVLIQALKRPQIKKNQVLSMMTITEFDVYETKTNITFYILVILFYRTKFAYLQLYTETNLSTLLNTF